MGQRPGKPPEPRAARVDADAVRLARRDCAICQHSAAEGSDETRAQCGKPLYQHARNITHVAALVNRHHDLDAERQLTTSLTCAVALDGA